MEKEFKEILTECLIEDLEKETKPKARWTLTPPTEPGFYLGYSDKESKYQTLQIVKSENSNMIWYKLGAQVSLYPYTIWNGYWYSKPIKVPKFKKPKG